MLPTRPDASGDGGGHMHGQSVLLSAPGMKEGGEGPTMCNVQSYPFVEEVISLSVRVHMHTKCQHSASRGVEWGARTGERGD